MTTQKHATHWINGEWINTGTQKQSINPANSEVIGTYVKGGVEEAELAIKVALDTFKNTDWRYNRELRFKVLNDLADAFEARQDELIQAIALENGKIVPEATFEVQLVMSGLRYGSALVYAESGRASEWSAGKMSMLIKEPVGVAGISVPWNSPAALLIRSLAPALAVGCTTVLKMPVQSAQISALIADIMSSVKSLPKGVINMVIGGHEVLSTLVNSPDVPTISFTGSTTTGRALLEQGAKQIKRFGLELGGKTPHIVFDDADLDKLIPTVQAGLTTFAGQFCMTGSRILVQKGIADKVRERLAEALKSVKVGPASDPTSQMGPMIDIPNVQRVDKMVEEGIAAGAKVIVRGGPFKEGELSKGAFYQPALLEVDDNKSSLVQQELFGPVLTMQVFDTERQAIEWANDSEFGLAASIWTNDGARSLRIAREIDAGTVWINDWVVMREEFEEGGYKQSGMGRLRGIAALEDFVEYKHIVLQPGVATK
ncbi:MAG: aldehyde dehydrogenase family protein [[Pasteurella] aerogenes]|nr:aldehyde dehydrogenase family protein [[Pasteurella] aerogenes]